MTLPCEKCKHPTFGAMIIRCFNCDRDRDEKIRAEGMAQMGGRKACGIGEGGI
jgi:hypothetical protein